MRITHNQEHKDKVAHILLANKSVIKQSWRNLAMQDDILNKRIVPSFLKLTLEKMINCFINCLSSEVLEIDTNRFILMAEDMLYKDISYSDFIKVMEYFQESCINAVLKDTDDIDIDKHLSLFNSLYNDSIACITEEYFIVKDDTIYALVKLAELRDDTTGTHLERTREYTSILAKELGMDHNFVKNITRASMLHDIGKVGIRDSILLKPGRLTSEEFEEMKQHTIIGAETIHEIINNTNAESSYLIMAKDIALHHHEKYDGSGYPFGLQGDKIPLESRIFALADVYDAIVSKRPYKEPLEHKHAVKTIVSCSGKHFDPQVVATFISVQQEFNRINTLHSRDE